MQSKKLRIYIGITVTVIMLLALYIVTKSSIIREFEIIHFPLSNPSLEIPRRYLHQNIGPFKNNMSDSGILISVPDNELKNLKFYKNEKTFILFRLYSIDKVDEKEFTNWIDSRISEINIVGKKIETDEKTGWYRVYTKDVDIMWDIIRKKPPITNSDYVASCSQSKLAEVTCALHVFCPVKGICVDLSLILSDLKNYKEIRDYVEFLVKEWQKEGNTQFETNRNT